MKAIPQWAQEVFEEFESPMQEPCQFDDERGPTEIVGDEMPEMYAIFEDR